MKNDRASKREMLAILSERRISVPPKMLRLFPRRVRQAIVGSARQNAAPTKETKSED